MDEQTTPGEPTVVRRIFESWSIEIPASFEELFVPKDGYWHAYDPHRSVSVTSLRITDDHGPVPEARVLEAFRLDSGDGLPGQPIPDLPVGTRGWAVITSPVPPARASRAISGMLVDDGRILLATITSDDLDWARSTWRSIRRHQRPGVRPH